MDLSLLKNYIREYYYRLLGKPSVYRSLKRAALFSGLKRESLKQIADHAKIKTYHANDLIIQEGDRADECYVIQSGTVEIFSVDEKNNLITINQLSHPAFFGEQALLETTPKTRNASVKALTDTLLIAITQKDFFNALNSSYKMRFGLRLIGNKQLIQRLSKQIEIFRSLDNKISETLANTIQTYQNGHILFKKDDEPDFIYYIIEGRIHIILDETKPDHYIEINPGQIFGELGFMRMQKRSGTALVVDHAKLLVISYDHFYQLYSSTPKLRELIGTLNQVYENTSRGIISQYTGSFLGTPTISTSFFLPDGRTVISSQVIGKNIFSMTHIKKIPDKNYYYSKGNAIRNIQIENNIIIGAIVTGFWEELSYLSEIILDATPITFDQIAQFKRIGSIKIASQPIPEMVCHCMRISREQIIDTIQSGQSTMEGVCQTTGAGSVCGSCRPSINELLGNTHWSIAGIEKINPLNHDIRIYHLKLQHEEMPAYLPGQHITIQMLIGTIWIERTYTLISVSDIDDDYQIIVKLEKTGAFSNWLFANDHEKPLFRISKPTGTFLFDSDCKRPAVFFAGGIGITPAIAFSRSLLEKHWHHKLYIDYSEHNENEFIYTNEFLNMQNRLPNFTIHFRLTHHHHRLNAADIENIYKTCPDADFYICGPSRYIADVHQTLLALDVAPERIKVESFILIKD